MTNHPPCSSNASPAARKLLARLQTLRGKATLSAQHDYITSGTRYFDAVATLLGRQSSIFGSDLSFEYHGSQPDAIGHCGPTNLTEPGHQTEWQFAPEKIFDPESPGCGRGSCPGAASSSVSTTRTSSNLSELVWTEVALVSLTELKK